MTMEAGLRLADPAPRFGRGRRWMLGALPYHSEQRARTCHTAPAYLTPARHLAAGRLTSARPPEGTRRRSARPRQAG